MVLGGLPLEVLMAAKSNSAMQQCRIRIFCCASRVLIESPLSWYNESKLNCLEVMVPAAEEGSYMLVMYYWHSEQ